MAGFVLRHITNAQGSSEGDFASMDGDTADRQHVKKVHDAEWLSLPMVCKPIFCCTAIHCLHMQAAAAMAVGVGSFSDPEDVPVSRVAEQRHS